MRSLSSPSSRWSPVILGSRPRTNPGGRMSDSEFDRETVDRLLSTTRTVRKRLDLSKPVPDEVILECLRLAIQAPTGSNMQTWRFVVVTDEDKRAGVAAAYRKGVAPYLEAMARFEGVRTESGQRVFQSAEYLG